MRMEFQVTYIDGRVVDAVARTKQIVAFERQYGKSFADFASKTESPRFEWLAYLAWAALHFTRQEPQAFDDFLDTVDTVEVKDDEVETVDPTQPEASPEPSPELPS